MNSTGGGARSQIVFDTIDEKVMMVVNAESANGFVTVHDSGFSDINIAEQPNMMPIVMPLASVVYSQTPPLSSMQPTPTVLLPLESSIVQAAATTSTEQAASTTWTEQAASTTSTVQAASTQSPILLPPSQSVQPTTTVLLPPPSSFNQRQNRQPARRQNRSASQRRQVRPTIQRSRAVERPSRPTMRAYASESLAQQKMMLEELRQNTKIQSQITANQAQITANQAKIIIALERLNNR